MRNGGRIRASRLSGYGEARLLEIVAQVALSALVNMVNEVAQTVAGFPVVQPRRTGCPESSMLQARRHQRISGDML